MIRKIPKVGQYAVITKAFLDTFPKLDAAEFFKPNDIVKIESVAWFDTIDWGVDVLSKDNVKYYIKEIGSEYWAFFTAVDPIEIIPIIEDEYEDPNEIAVGENPQRPEA